MKWPRFGSSILLTLFDCSKLLLVTTIEGSTAAALIGPIKLALLQYICEMFESTEDLSLVKEYKFEW